MVDLKVATLDGSNVTLSEERLEEFKGMLRGEAIQPHDDNYDEVRQVWNGMVDKRPALILQCAGVADVISSVNFARENNLIVSVRGGGHSIAGNALYEDGLMIDLSLMKSIHVDVIKRTARVEGGATWQDLDHETQAFGLATTGGFIPTTGVS